MYLAAILLLVLNALSALAFSVFLFLSADLRNTARDRSPFPNLYIWFLSSVALLVFFCLLAAILGIYLLGLRLVEVPLYMPLYASICCLSIFGDHYILYRC